MKITRVSIANILYFIIFGVFAARVLTENFGVTYSIMYIFDVMLIFLLVIGVVFNRKIQIKNIQVFLEIIILLFANGVVSLHINGVDSYVSLFSGIRQYFRLPVSFIVGYSLLKNNSIAKINRFLTWLIYINVFVMTYQYFLLGLKQDWIGGTFGNTPGCNSIQNVIFCICFAYSLIEYLHGKGSKKQVILVGISSVYLAALAEITVFYFELVVILFICVLIVKTPWKKMKLRRLNIMVGGIIIVFVGVFVYLKVFPNRAFLLSPNNLLDYIGYYENSTGVYKISRVRVFKQLGNEFLNKRLLYGLGLGNCSINSNFYVAYEYILNYEWFSSAMVFLETGYIGVILYIMFFIYVFLKANKIKFKRKLTDNMLISSTFSQIVAILCIILFFYDSSLRENYTAYLLGIALSSAFVPLRYRA